MTFAVNYVGEPFATSLAQNKMFAVSVRYSVIMFFLLSTDIVYGLCGWFSLVSMPSELKYKMVGLAWISFVVCMFIERAARELFPAALPPEKGGIAKKRRA